MQTDRHTNIHTRSLAPVLGNPVHFFHKLSEEGIDAVVNEIAKAPDGLLIRQVHAELLAYFAGRLVGLQGNVLHVGVHHERKKIEDEVRVLAQDEKCAIAMRTEPPHLVTIGPTHTLHHVLVELERWWIRFGVAPEDKAKVNMKEAAIAA